MIANYTDEQIEQEIEVEEAYIAELKTERLNRMVSRSTRRLPTPERILDALRHGVGKRSEIEYALVGVSSANLDMHLRKLRDEGKIRAAGRGRYELCDRLRPVADPSSGGSERLTSGVSSVVVGGSPEA